MATSRFSLLPRRFPVFAITAPPDGHLNAARPVHPRQLAKCWHGSGVRVIGKRGLFERANSFSDARTALQVWLETAKAATWNSLEDIRKVFPTTDMVGRLPIFNVKGNRYRLIVRVEFRSGRIYIKRVFDPRGI